MNRCVALLFAVCCAAVTVSSACIAQPNDWVHFALEPSREGGTIRADFRSETSGREYDSPMGPTSRRPQKGRRSTPSRRC